MGSEASKQKFAIASSMYLEGRYEEALVYLDELGKQYPGVFNIQFPMLQCLQRLERLEDVKELHEQMQSLYTEERYCQKLENVSTWITNMERQSSFGVVGLELEIEPTAMDIDMMGDLFEPSTPKKKSSPSQVPVSSGSNMPLKALLVLGVVALAGAAAYFFLPTLLGAAPQFSANIVLGLPSANLEGVFYRKSIDVSRTEMMGKVLITKGGNVYTLIPDAQKYSVKKLAEMSGGNPFAEMSDFEKWISANGGKKTGSENLYGYECDVYEATVRMNAGMPPADTKIWYARDLEFPVKSETIAVGILGKIVMFLKDIKVGSVSAELFEIPPGFSKVDDEELRRMGIDVNIGGTPSAPSRDINDVPDNTRNLSPQEMKKLLQQFKMD